MPDTHRWTRFIGANATKQFFWLHKKKSKENLVLIMRRCVQTNFLISIVMAKSLSVQSILNIYCQKQILEMGKD